MTEQEQLALFDLPPAPPHQKVFRSIDQPLWTKHKAKLISRYLYYFVLITRHGVYIDGFAGPQQPDQPDSWAAKLVLESEPRWMREFALCDNETGQVTALEKLRDDQPETAGRSVRVFHGDFNAEVATILDTAKIGEKTATFCLLDQRTFECDWETVRKVAHRKKEKKIEIFYFVPTGWLARSISALREPETKMPRWWGEDGWQDLRGMSNADVVETFRQRFIDEFGYKHAHGWPIYDRQGSQRIMYHMVHASDHDEAPNLMSRAYKTATRRAEPREQFTFEFERFVRNHGRTIEMGSPTD